MSAFKAVSLAVCVLFLLAAGALVGRGLSLVGRKSQELIEE